MTQEQKKKGTVEKYYDGKEDLKIKAPHKKGKKGEPCQCYPDGELKVEGTFDLSTKKGRYAVRDFLLNSRRKDR